jgi:hypothetical protein
MQADAKGQSRSNCLVMGLPWSIDSGFRVKLHRQETFGLDTNLNSQCLGNSVEAIGAHCGLVKQARLAKNHFARKVANAETIANSF